MNSKKVTSVECTGIEKRGAYPNRHYVYVIIVEWSNGDKHPVYRKYGSFFDFEKALRFRVGQKVQLPELPAMNIIEKTLRIQKNHVDDINSFCKGILRLSDEIKDLSVITAFFEVWRTDFPQEDSGDDEQKFSCLNKLRKLQPEERRELMTYLKAVNTGSQERNNSPNQSKEWNSSLDQEDEEARHVVTCGYVAKSADELSLEIGTTVVVLERYDDGWWFVMVGKDGKQGYAPGAFLQPVCRSGGDEPTQYTGEPQLSRTRAADRVKGNISPKPVMRARALSDFQSASGDEISFATGDQLEVLSTNSTGWWTVRCHDAVGLVPAVHLELDDCSARSNTVILRNNSLYGKKPPPRSRNNCQDLAAPEMANRVPVPKVEDTPGLNYAELVFEDGSDGARPVKKGSLKNQPDAQAGRVIYTEIVPKNLRAKKDESHSLKEKENKDGSKLERLKAIWKDKVGKVTEDSASKSQSYQHSLSTGDAPSVAISVLKPLSPSSQHSKPLPPVHTCAHPSGDSSENATRHTYMNITLPGDSAAGEDIRRSSIVPPPPPSVDASFPKGTPKDSWDTAESYELIQAKETYGGPAVSGMLMFTKGDIANLLSKAPHTNWWYVNLKGLEGYVPGPYWEPIDQTLPDSNSVKSPTRKAPTPMPRTQSPSLWQTTLGSLQQQPWYHGKMSRPQSEAKLAPYNNGDYLIRESVNRIGDLTLSVKWEGKTRHFPIEAKEGGLYNIGKHDFTDLCTVIQHYSKHTLFFSENNVAVKLQTPIPKTS